MHVPLRRAARDRRPYGGRRLFARVKITGLIRNDDERVDLLERLAKSTSAMAVIVRIDLPWRHDRGFRAVARGAEARGGGQAAGRRGRRACGLGRLHRGDGADHIFAQETSLVGSIGVLFQYPNLGELLETIGVNVET